MGAGLSLASVLPGLAWARAPIPSAAASHAPLLLLVDPRTGRGQARIAVAAQRGTPVVTVDDDVTRFFYERLHGRWREEVPHLAGLTAWGPYFCLTQLARDQDMRIELHEEFAEADGQRLYAWSASPRIAARPA